MAEKTKKIINSLLKEGFSSKMNKEENRKYLKLAVKDERGVPVSTGKHYVKFAGEEFVNDITVFLSKDNHIKVQGFRYKFIEDNEEVYYDVPLYDREFYKDQKNRVYHYLLDKFADIDIGDDLIIRYVKDGSSGYIDVKKVYEKRVDDMDDDTGNDTEDISVRASLEEDFGEYVQDNETSNTEVGKDGVFF